MPLPPRERVPTRPEHSGELQSFPPFERWNDWTELDAKSWPKKVERRYQLIPTIVGVTIDPALAVIAGTAYDVVRDAAISSAIDTGKIEGAQVIVYDENGEIPDTLSVNYFTDEFPDRDQKWTSADGLWVAANVPAGNLRIEMWGQVNGELTLLGATSLFSEADSINISNVFAGYGDGVKYPYACEEAMSGTTR